MVYPTTAAIVGGAHGAPYGRAAEHYNPVKHGLVTKVSDWPYSTFHRHVRLGTYEVTYSVSIKQSAAKSLEKIPRPERLRIIEAIDSLKRYPGAGSVLNRRIFRVTPDTGRHVPSDI